MSGRGAGWVVAQFVLMAAVLAAGFVPPDWPDGRAARALASSAPCSRSPACAFAVWAGRTLGRSLTPFPKPVEAGLVTQRAVRGRPAPDLHGRARLLRRATRSSRASRRSSSRSCSRSSGPAKIRVEERLLVAVYDGLPGATRRACAGASSRSSTRRRRPSYNRAMPWPEPVERVAVFLRAAGAESRLEELASDAATAQAAAEAIGCALDQIVKSLVFVCDDAARAGARSRETAGPTPAKIAARGRRRRGAGRAATRGRRRDGLRPRRGRAVPASRRRARPRRADDPLERGRLGRRRVGASHGDGVAARARAADERHARSTSSRSRRTCGG